MSIAARHDVAELIVPIPLIESTIPKNANEDEASQYVLKNVR